MKRILIGTTAALAALSVSALSLAKDDTVPAEKFDLLKSVFIISAVRKKVAVIGMRAVRGRAIGKSIKPMAITRRPLSARLSSASPHRRLSKFFRRRCFTPHRNDFEPKPLA